MAGVTFSNTQHLYPGAAVPAVAGLDLEIRDGEFMVIVGPSGCGKSTTLRMLAGLESVTAGRIAIGDRDVTHVEAKHRDIAMVFQNYALYPHMTVAENMGFALRMARMPAADRDRRVEDVADLLGLAPYLHRKPSALSGGQRQRVAMGRAIVRRPQVFCMDEPLSNLDAKMRVKTRTDIASLQAELRVTTLYVTHDQVEAMTMGDRVAVMKDGVLQQVDTPLGLYERPANVFVAGFIGSPQMNLLPGQVVSGVLTVGDRLLAAPAAAGDGPVTVGVRPEHWRRTSPGDGLPVTVRIVEELGADAFIYGTSVIEGVDHDLIVRVGGRERIARGDVLHVHPVEDDLHVFDGVTGLRLRRDREVA